MRTPDGWEFARFLEIALIEVYYQGLKQTTSIEGNRFRLAVAQRNHIGFAIRAFLRLEIYRLESSTSWLDAKSPIIRNAIRSYLGDPSYILVPTA
jgi:putative transposase